MAMDEPESLQVGLESLYLSSQEHTNLARRLCTIYLIDSLSFLQRSEVEECRCVSQHLNTTTLQEIVKLPRRRFKNFRVMFVSDQSLYPLHL